MKTVCAAAVAAIAAAPAFAQESPKALQEAFIAAVEAENAAAIAALYLEGADSYAPDGTTATGSEAIAASWAAFFAAYEDISVTADQRGERKFGDAAHASWGYWSMSMTPAGGGPAETVNGRFTDVAVKTKAGWRYVVDHASPRAEIREPAAQ